MPNQPTVTQRLRRVLQNPAFPLACLAIVILLVIPAIVWARAGDGGGFGGGGGGGGSSDDGGWILELLYYLIWFAIEYPPLGVPLLIIVVAALYFSGQFAKLRYQDNVITRGQRADGVIDQQQAAGIINATDPAFDQAAFLSRVSTAFMRVQAAWTAQDLESIRPFVSDGIAERFSLQFQEQRDSGYRNQMDKVQVTAATLSDARSGSVFNSVTVCIRAKAIDYHVGLADGKYLSGSRALEAFTEFWTFVRRNGGTSPAPGKPGLLEGNCPNCGALVKPPKSADGSALSLGGSAKCAACGSLLRSGMLDWVLTEVTQGAATAFDDDSANATTIQSYQAVDPGFSPELIEDRASVAFWRWVKAQRIGNVTPLRKSCTPEFCDETAAQIKADTDASGRRIFTGRCAVGAVDTLGVLLGPQWDRAIVRIEWSGTKLAIKPGSKTPEPAPGGGVRVWIGTLIRKNGATSDPDLGLSSAHCPNCGAAQSDDAADVCAYCSAVLNDGQNAWVLRDLGGNNTDIAQSQLTELRAIQGGASTPERDEHPNALPSPSSIVGMIGWLAETIADDGVITDEELRLFRAMCDNNELSTRQSEAILAAAKARKTDNAPKPATPQEARKWLAQLAAAVADHGRIAAEDQALMSLAAEKIGLSDWDAKAVAKSVRAQTLRDARQSLRTRLKSRQT